MIAGCPGGVSGYPRAWYRSVSWVRVPPSAYSYKFVGTFSCAQIDLRKARKRELATLDENSTSSGIAEPYAPKKLKARTGGEKGWHLERHLWPRLVQKLESKSVWKTSKKKKMNTFIVSAHRLINITMSTLVQATLMLWFQGESPPDILNEHTHPVIRAIGVPHTAWKDDFRQDLRSHSRSVFLFLICIYICIFILRRTRGKKKLKLTPLPRIFIHVVCRFNSIAFAIQR